MMKFILSLLIFFTYTGFESSSTSDEGSILFSRVGYNLQGDKRIIIRSTSDELLGTDASFSIISHGGNEVLSGKPTYWGGKWNSHWWIIDFTELSDEGTYLCSVSDKNGIELQTKKFEVREDLLWAKTWEEVSIEQLDGRIKLRNENVGKHGPEYAQGGGWQDCGSYLREVNSHATMIIGLQDLLTYSLNKIPAQKQNDVLKHMMIGLDYLAFCQDKGRELGKGDGAIIHEWPKHTNVITGDVVKGALCFVRGSQLLTPHDAEKSEEFLERAERSFLWLDMNGPINHPGGTNFSGTILPDDGFNRIVYGAPQGFVRPDEWKTRDIVMMVWVALELSKAGKDYRDKAVEYAGKLIGRQIPSKGSEGKYYGHFKAFESVDFSEKAWEHHEMGYDAGSTFPHYIIPLIEMTSMWPDHKDAASWKKAIENFAYGYFLPACSDNPFLLLPVGYFKDEGLLNFSGLWHGMNGAYGSAAALALELKAYTGNDRFGSIATGNLQWISGLNSGIDEGNGYTSKSMIYGVGDEYIGSWTKITGTICNGFESDGQFIFTEPSLELDGPFVFTDEGWITHSGGWLSAISRLGSD